MFNFGWVVKSVLIKSVFRCVFPGVRWDGESPALEILIAGGGCW